MKIQSYNTTTMALICWRFHDHIDIFFRFHPSDPVPEPCPVYVLNPTRGSIEWCVEDFDEKDALVVDDISWIYYDLCYDWQEILDEYNEYFREKYVTDKLDEVFYTLADSGIRDDVPNIIMGYLKE